jgi:uncharacterized protein YeeX (DUF496 family)
MRKARKNFHEQIKQYGHKRIARHNKNVEKEIEDGKKAHLDKKNKSDIIYKELSYNELRTIAKEKNIKDYWKKTKEVLLEELIEQERLH